MPGASGADQTFDRTFPPPSPRPPLVGAAAARGPTPSGRASGTSGLTFADSRFVGYESLSRSAGKLNMCFGAEGGACEGWWMCSASLIGRSLLVTAAHCVHKYGKQAAGWPASIEGKLQIYWQPGMVNGTAPFGEWWAEDLMIGSPYFNGTDTCDSYGPGVSCNNDLVREERRERMEREREGLVGRGGRRLPLDPAAHPGRERAGGDGRRPRPRLADAVRALLGGRGRRREKGEWRERELVGRRGRRPSPCPPSVQRLSPWSTRGTGGADTARLVDAGSPSGRAPGQHRPQQRPPARACARGWWPPKAGPAGRWRPRGRRRGSRLLPRLPAAGDGRGGRRAAWPTGGRVHVTCWFLRSLFTHTRLRAPRLFNRFQGITPCPPLCLSLSLNPPSPLPLFILRPSST